MSPSIIMQRLANLLQTAPTQRLSSRDRFVVFSDLHIGNGGSRDDLLKNQQLLLTVLEDYYLKGEYTLVLNGDIEELQKFSLQSILNSWQPFYELLDNFLKEGRLIRMIGNHDYSLHLHKKEDFKGDLHQAWKLDYKGHAILLFHGHQASSYYEKYNDINGLLLRYIVHPLRIKNRSAAYDSQKRYSIEKKVYQFSSRNKIVSIIGHTHRPLFESLSRVDYLKYEIEQLCRLYLSAGKKEKRRIEKDIVYYKEELHRTLDINRKMDLYSSIYNTTVVVPCVFNSGCGVGKRGITGIEISGGKIYLVHWFDRKRSKKYFEHYEHHPEKLGQSNFYRMVLKEEFLDYIFTRIQLLT